MTSPFTEVIAEAGVNHNGSLKLALELVDIAVGAGADGVKFQTFQAEKLATQKAPQAQYQEKNTGKKESQLEMLKRLELSYSDHFKLADYCKEKSIEFLSTPFDPQSAEFLIKEMKLKRIKISSGDLTNGPLLYQIAHTQTPVILSTGMSELDEIKQALLVLAMGYDQKPLLPKEQLRKTYSWEKALQTLKSKVTLLHCTSAYPTPPSQVHLNVLTTLSKTFGLPVGYSDHTQGITIPIGAVALGACLIEKHFTLDRRMEGPDHLASLNPEELKQMIEQIRITEKALGSPHKTVVDCERSTRKVARKSLTALESISEGETFSEKNLGVKRPGDGVSAMEYWDRLGKKAERNYRPDEAIDP